MKYLKLFDLDDDYQSFIEGDEFVTPNVSYIKDNQFSYFNPYIDYSTQYFHVEALEDGLTVKLSGNTIFYSIDECTTWNELSSNTESPAINAGEKIYFKGNLTSNSQVDYGNGTFSMTKQCDVKGNTMSLLYGDEFANKTALNRKNGTFQRLFSGCTEIVNAKDLILPATTLADYCYAQMFMNCTSLTSAPKLPATALTQACYSSMFNSCSSLTTAPELPATTLANSCYYYMFSDCTSLTTAPELPAATLEGYCYFGMFKNCTSLTSAPSILPVTTVVGHSCNSMFSGCRSLTVAPKLPATILTQYSYQNMFKNCTSLTVAPELPATTLEGECYSHMFENCTSLTTAPELPATTLTRFCYYYMFCGCSKLNYIKMLATDISASNCLIRWVSGVSSTGTLVKSAGVEIPSGVDGIPSGWEVQEV